VLVDHDRAAEAAVTANLTTTGFDGVARFRRSTVSAFVAGPATDAPFDVVFLDTPYDLSSEDVSGVLAALAAGNVVAPDGTVVVERPTGADPLTLPAGWGIEKDRAYGDTLLVVAHAG
jgi:16S rRNA (guanine966-N2)-methyltransferase